MTTVIESFPKERMGGNWNEKERQRADKQHTQPDGLNGTMRETRLLTFQFRLNS